MRYIVAALLTGALVALSVALAGCGQSRPPPSLIECHGKGTITGTGTASVDMLGGGSNAFSVTVDCGEGVLFRVVTPATTP
jgi:hypothetical protein